MIILDRSGSMAAIGRAAVEGFNETLAGIRSAQKKYADTQEHYVSLVTFCSCKIEHVFDKTSLKDARPLRMEDYEPCCYTPLYDAMGFTLTDMYKYVKDMEDRMVVVTVITDGMENDSKEYDASAIRSLITKLRSEGWTFTYMGANQDAILEARKIGIRNSTNFDYSHAGIKCAFSSARSHYSFISDKLAELKLGNVQCESMSEEERRKLYSEMADEAFDENNA